jgi:hypothetical protein
VERTILEQIAKPRKFNFAPKGMINNEDGGIILLGIQENKLIDGLMLSKAQ